MNQTKLEFLTTCTLGLFAGAMLFIALCILPFWSSLAPGNYREAFQLMGPFVGAKMIPLMVGSILLSGLCVFTVKPGRLRWILVFVCVAAVVPLYATIHAPVNSVLLGNEPLPLSEIVALRNQWSHWHWVRAGLGLVAFGLSARQL